MNIKSLLIGSATAMVLTSGAQAADAIVYADPEPMEYVRICDVYGAGFFYIPGTETCLKIGGYVRFDAVGAISSNVFPGAVGPFTRSGYFSMARFSLQTDARSETEWGTLRGYAEVRSDYFSGVLGTASYINEAYIELINPGGTLRVGKADTPYSRWLGYGGLDGTLDISADLYGVANGYAFRNANEISYTFTGSSGFSAFVALLDNPTDNTWRTNVEGGVLLSQDWGSIGGMVGYDAVTSNWGASAAATGKFGAVTAKLQGFYNSDLTGNSWYSIYGPGHAFAAAARWSVLGSVAAEFSPTVTAAVTGQWFDNNGGWLAGGEIQWTPVENLAITPGVHYFNGAGNNFWGAAVRVQRSF